jgi:hypothetical protein
MVPGPMRMRLLGSLAASFALLMAGCKGSSGEDMHGDAAVHDATTATDATTAHDATTVHDAAMDAGADGAVDSGADAAEADAAPDAAPDIGEPPPPTHRLTITFAGDGAGQVVDPAAGIDCDATCEVDVPEDTSLSLEAIPGVAATFDGWDGACGGQAGCAFVITGDTTVHATFTALRNYVFVTSALLSPSTIGSAAAADAICQAAADAGDARLAGRTYVAWLSDTSSDALDRLGDASGWIRLDGKPFALRRDDLLGTSAPIRYPARLDENGVDLGTTVSSPSDLGVATGTGTNGRLFPGEHCDDWSDATEPYFGGRADAGSQGFGSSFGYACSIPARLLCLGVDYDSPLPALAPPPAGARIVFRHNLGATAPAPGVAGLDVSCQAAATGAGLIGTYRALVATSTASAASRFTFDARPWYRRDGVVAVSDSASLLTGGLPDAPLGMTLAGAITTATIRTGAYDIVSPGDIATTCDDWSDYSGETNIRWTRGFYSASDYFGGPFYSACTTGGSIYCLAD